MLYLNIDPSLKKKFSDYLFARRISKNSIIAYLLTIFQKQDKGNNRKKGFSGLLEVINKDPQNIELRDIEKYCIYLRENYKNNSLTTKFSAIIHFLKYLDKTELFETAKKDGLLKFPRQIPPDKIPLTKDEIQKIFEASKHNLRDGALIKTLYYTCQSKASIINLKLGDIKEKDGEIHIYRKKTHQEYNVAIDPDGLKAIKNYIENGRPEPKEGYEDLLFLSYYGRPISECRVWQLVKEYASKAGIKKKVYPHIFRTSSITHLDEAGRSIFQIKMQSGHRSLKALQSYIKPDWKKTKPEIIKALSLDKQSKTNKQDESKDTETTLRKKNIDTSHNETENYIASLEHENEQLRNKLREKESSEFMYG